MSERAMKEEETFLIQTIKKEMKTQLIIWA